MCGNTAAPHCVAGLSALLTRSIVSAAYTMIELANPRLSRFFVSLSFPSWFTSMNCTPLLPRALLLSMVPNSQMSSSRPLPSPSLGDNGLPSGVPGFRTLLPAPVSNSEGTSSGSDRGPSLRSHLPPRVNLTKIACEPCRKRKAKVRAEVDRSMFLLGNLTSSAR